MALHLSTLAIRLEERLVNVQQGIAENEAADGAGRAADSSVTLRHRAPGGWLDESSGEIGLTAVAIGWCCARRHGPAQCTADGCRRHVPAVMLGSVQRACHRPGASGRQFCTT